MGFTTNCNVRDEAFPALMVFNALYGAGMTSKLFMNVREKLSLCYYASSTVFASKGVLMVSSGIDTKDYEKAKAEILAQLEECRCGEISREELDNAKKAIVSSLDTIPDSPGHMEDHHMFRILSGQPLDIAAYRAAVQAVTVGDVVAAARKVRLDTTFFLKGGQA